MKKLISGLVILLALFLSSVYLIIPAQIRVEASVTIQAPLPAVSRSLQSSENWKKWWPGDRPFYYADQQYTISGKIFNALDIDVVQGNDSLHSRLNLVLNNVDSTTVGWMVEVSSSIYPWQRIAQYRQAKKLQKNLLQILSRMKGFMEKTENIYGFQVMETRVTDSVLIFTSQKFPHPPTVAEVSELIQKLKKYISQNNAMEKNFPMLHILKADATHYEARVAIPVDRRLPETQNFVPKFLLKGGNILEAEIKGGPHTIENAFREFENYRADHKYTSPAIPYQLLVTDRAREADTANWITRLYYPVF